MQPEALAWALAQATGSRWLALAEAYTSGELEVTFADGRSVRYRSIAEIGSVISAGYATSVVSSPTRRPAMTVARVGDGFL